MARKMETDTYMMIAILIVLIILAFMIWRWQGWQIWFMHTHDFDNSSLMKSK